MFIFMLYAMKILDTVSVNTEEFLGATFYLRERLPEVKQRAFVQNFLLNKVFVMNRKSCFLYRMLHGGGRDSLRVRERSSNLSFLPMRVGRWEKSPWS